MFAVIIDIESLPEQVKYSLLS
uniref:Uncharacterized protein n=1 Tax=Anguilla anguilla TaxID=7936 RepID=A0A0E9R5M3_ANGAN